jgi:diguanylate cyclase (GGDEF)-like protein/PAS domain S-box-containing protein
MMACAAMEYLGIASVPVLFLILTLLYTGREKWVTRRNIILLFVIPFITILMVATNQLHHLYYSSTGVDTHGSFPMLALTRGPWFWGHSVYSYALLLTGTLLLVVRLGKRGSVFHSQVVAMLVGVSVPWAVSILYVAFGLMPLGHVDPTPFAFTITGVVIAWSIFRYGLFNIMPLAYDRIADSLDDAIVVLDRQKRIVEYNKAARIILEVSRDDIGKSSAIVWKDRPDLLNLSEKDEESRIEMVRDRLGSMRYYEASTYNVENRHGRPIGKAISLHDTTEKKHAEEALRQSEEKYRALVENINDVLFALDNRGTITYVSPAVERLSKYKASDLIGKPFTQLIYPDDLPELLDRFTRLMSGQVEPWEFRVFDIDGRVIFVRSSSRPQYEDGEIVGITTLLTDITERKAMEQKLEEMATHDFLTGLPNRVLLLDRFAIAAALAQRNKARIAVMSLDLDRFKLINDTLGHEAGDQVLKVFSARLTDTIRASDTLARIGGDEFILLMMEPGDMNDKAATAQKILDAFIEPLSINGNKLHLSTSIGIAIYPDDAEDLETLTRKSDAAMYYCKRHGRNQFKFFGDGDVPLSGDSERAT